jgi:hypothetical protein
MWKNTVCETQISYMKILNFAYQMSIFTCELDVLIPHKISHVQLFCEFSATKDTNFNIQTGVKPKWMTLCRLSRHQHGASGVMSARKISLLSYFDMLWQFYVLRYSWNVKYSQRNPVSCISGATFSLIASKD